MKGLNITNITKPEGIMIYHFMDKQGHKWVRNKVVDISVDDFVLSVIAIDTTDSVGFVYWIKETP